MMLLTSSSLAELAGLNDDEEVEDTPLLLSAKLRKKRRVAAQDERVLKRLGAALRPSRPSMRLQLFRVPAKSFEPDEVARVNRRFNLLLKLVQPEDPEDVLKETYSRCFKFPNNSRIMYRVRESTERKDLKDAMADVLVMSRDLKESKEMIASFGAAGVSDSQRTNTTPSHTRHTGSGPKNPHRREPDRTNVAPSKGKPIDKPKHEKKPFVCFNCGKVGHSARRCPAPKTTCSKCQKPGHRAEFCRSEVNSARCVFSLGSRQSVLPSVKASILKQVRPVRLGR
ncbi:hypothetical protein J8273_4143 [Carpediemonas membranifera]|uniref:CCHC-type domain-containing protein n=1 Tax=Carpediemonas membranifera TaxID=201153 RepID=A0A8J6B7Q2_9EUKA|nr:hypothetical protein J8273_4143 [Carpediemonas membranifera]|eukprot:KAG9394472.1 hypothetical protein J8273_4143 [Carpediemonas membranifera]